MSGFPGGQKRLIFTVNLDLSGVEAVENYLNNKWFNVPIP